MVTMPESDVETLDVLYIGDDPGLAEMYRLKLELDGYGSGWLISTMRWQKPAHDIPTSSFWSCRRGGLTDSLSSRTCAMRPAGRTCRPSFSPQRAAGSSGTRARPYLPAITSSGSRRRIANR